MTEPDPAIADAVAEVEAAGDHHLTVIRLLTGGYQSGAYLVTDCGRPAVLKWTADPGWAEVVVQAAPMVAAARAAGWPTPVWLACGRTRSGGAYQLQEFAAGTAEETITLDWVAAVLPAIERQAGLGSAAVRDWSWFDRELVFGDSPTRRAVAGSGTTGAQVAAAVTRLCRPYAGVRLPTDDLVHGDLNPGNVLLLDGAVSALVDVEAIGRGSRLHDLATVVVYGTLWPSEPGAVERTLAHAETIADPGQLEISMAAVTLGLLEFGVLHWPADDLASICRTATAMLERLGNGPGRMTG